MLADGNRANFGPAIAPHIQALQQTAAAILVSRSITALGAAAVAELGLYPANKSAYIKPNSP